MNESQKNRYEKYKVVAFVTLVIFAICAGFSSYIIWHGQQDIAEKISANEKTIQAIASIVGENNATKYKRRIKSFLNIKAAPVREEILKAFERQDREGLLKLSKPYFKLFKKENPHFKNLGWVLPNNRVFLRIHKPEMLAEDISVLRPDLVRANKDLQQNYGYMPGHAGLSFRVVQPVIYKGNHLGVVQFGLSESLLVDMLQKQFEDVLVYQVIPAKTFQKVKFSTLPSYIDGSFTVQSHEHDIDLLKSASTAIDWSLDQQRTVIQGKDYVISKVLDLSNYEGKPEGWLFALTDISELTSEMRTDIIIIISLSIILILLSSFIISKSYNKLIDKITQQNIRLEGKVVERTKELAAEKERLAVTLRSIGDGVITTDIEGKIVLINKVAEDLTGWSNEDASGKLAHEVFSIVNEKTGQKCASPVSRVLELGRIVGLANHTALIAKNGAQISIADSGAPIRDAQSKIVGVVIVFRDVTNERRIEEELLKTRKLESVGVLAGGIAHDFNNILAAILGNIELASLRV
ncbi:MAG: PAS domain S-box protein, partial [Thermodesulfobacteriota bacterium]|nr:PAS domain S-box protein [Thermodesulfobacteriota bacterium]